MTISDEAVVMLADLALLSLRRHRGPRIDGRPGCADRHCVQCVEWSRMYLLAQQTLPDLPQQLADHATKRLMRSGGGTDWSALERTVFARTVERP